MTAAATTETTTDRLRAFLNRQRQSQPDFLLDGVMIAEAMDDLGCPPEAIHGGIDDLERLGELTSTKTGRGLQLLFTNSTTHADALGGADEWSEGGTRPTPDTPAADKAPKPRRGKKRSKRSKKNRQQPTALETVTVGELLNRLQAAVAADQKKIRAIQARMQPKVDLIASLTSNMK